jgi:hypothetical protein
MTKTWRGVTLMAALPLVAAAAPAAAQEALGGRRGNEVRAENLGSAGMNVVDSTAGFCSRWPS